MKILVGSENPVKIQAVKEAFSTYFDDVEIVGLSVSSGVSNQPVNEETFEGAKNRAFALRHISNEKEMDADFFVGIEGGIIQLYSKWFAFGAMCIMDNDGRISFGTSPQFELPEVIAKQLLDGIELGLVADKLTGENNVKQKGGAIGFFTKDVMSRKDFYLHGLITALVPFINKEIYFSESQIKGFPHK